MKSFEISISILCSSVCSTSARSDSFLSLMSWMNPSRYSTNPSEPRIARPFSFTHRSPPSRCSTRYSTSHALPSSHALSTSGSNASMSSG